MAEAAGHVLLHLLDHPEVQLLIPIAVTFRPDVGGIVGEYPAWDVQVTEADYDTAIAALKTALADQYLFLEDANNRTSEGLEMIWEDMQETIRRVP